MPTRKPKRVQPGRGSLHAKIDSLSRTLGARMEELLDLREAHVILVGRHEQLHQMVERLQTSLREAHERCDDLARGHAQMGATFTKPSSRLADIENRITDLEQAEASGTVAARLEELENTQLLHHQQIHSLQGGKGLEPPAPVIKGGWMNIYKVFPDGAPDLNGQASGPWATRSEADELATDKRIACLYLQGNDE